jgi:SAM-dependent methyltransferase
VADLVPRGRLARQPGNASYEVVGRRWVETFQLWGGLQPTDRVLDVGCGAGRMAVALSEVMAPTARYEGFDVDEEAIRWCQRKITPKWPTARFTLIDIANEHYNADGSVDGSRLTFPYEDDSFDFVFLTSVFTHLLPPVVDRYFSEISRVLAPGGRALTTWFLLNDDVRTAVGAGSGDMSFAHAVAGGCYAERADDPEDALAYDESEVRRWHETNGLEIIEPIRFGGWSGAYTGNEVRHRQDCVIARAEA